MGGATFNVGRLNSLDGIKGAVTLNGEGGQETLNINDQANAAKTTYTLTARRWIGRARPRSLTWPPLRLSR